MDRLTYIAYPSRKAYLEYGLDAIWKKKLKTLRYNIIEKAVDRLAAYEDTNLTPAEVAELAQAEPVVRGRWINGDCSVCKAPIPTDSRYDYLDEYDCKYCYNCGAMMDKGGD